MKSISGTTSFKIIKSSLPTIAAFYVGLGVANFIILIPKGILSKIVGNGSYQTNVMELFSDRQMIMFYISVFSGVLIACAAEIISGIKTK